MQAKQNICKNWCLSKMLKEKDERKQMSCSAEILQEIEQNAVSEKLETFA